MRVSRLIRRLAMRWEAWRADRAIPERVMLRKARDEAQARHGRTKHIERAMKDIVTARLKLEMEMRNGR